jgi:hypothetical protein
MLTEKFYNDVYDMVSKEIEDVLFFVEEVAKNKSFITKMFENYLKSDSIKNSQEIDLIYS